MFPVKFSTASVKQRKQHVMKMTDEKNRRASFIRYQYKREAYYERAL